MINTTELSNFSEVIIKSWVKVTVNYIYCFKCEVNSVNIFCILDKIDKGKKSRDCWFISSVFNDVEGGEFNVEREVFPSMWDN